MYSREYVSFFSFNPCAPLSAPCPVRQTHSVGEEHEEHEKLMSEVQTAMDTLLGSSDQAKDDAARATLLAGLKVNLQKFGKDVLEHLDHEEKSFATPVARKVSETLCVAQL